MKQCRTGILLLLLMISHSVAAQVKKIVVAQDGSGNYKFLQAAFDAIPLGNKKPVHIYIRNGIYYEKLHLDSSKNFVTIEGEDAFKTILSYNDHTGKLSPKGDTINTYSSESFLMRANHFTAINISFRNDAGFNAGQAVAVQAYGDMAVFLNCRFIGFQDVLFTPNPSSRQYYEHCYIEGTTDFIFGASTVWFEQCHIHSKKNSHVTAASTPKGNPFGYVFNRCILTADSSLRGVSLGRPWRPYASVFYINCYLDKHIIPEGWNNWRNPENEKTARYGEYNSFGPGADISKRFSWTRQLTENDVEKIKLKHVFPGWDPLSQ